MSFDFIIEYLKNNLSQRRFQHTIGVADTAKKLADIYSADREKAYFAGLLHDCCKECSLEEMRNIISRNNGIADDIAYNSPAILHGVAGAYLAKEKFMADDEVFDAICYHTTGKPNMSLLTKIVYIADYIEPGRDFDGVETVRDMAYSNLDYAIIKSCSNVIIHTVNKGEIVHPDTVNARNYLLLNNRSVADDEKICK